MIRRGDQPDTEADLELQSCVVAMPRRCFVMEAGAGSGKTTSLIKLLRTILEHHGTALRLERRKVACITYTEIAAGEIWTDVGNNPLVHVSTIHSFLWSIVRPFQGDIHSWVERRIEERINELLAEAASYGPRVQERTREKNRRDIARYEAHRAHLGEVSTFNYGTGSDYTSGVLGHDDVLKMVPQLLTDHSLFRQLAAQQYPFLLVDESQDTMSNVVDALKAIERDARPACCLGFFGDPMQQIYATGVGKTEPEDGWARIRKPENYRCPAAVLAVANAIRLGVDGLVQTRGRIANVDGTPQVVPGTARIFVLPADERRDALVVAVRSWIADCNGDPAWQSNEGYAVKVLVIVHRMAAKRLGFADLYSAMNDKAPEAFKTGLLDATAWPLRPFMSLVMPLVDAIRDGREFEVMTLLRTRSPLLSREALKGAEVAAVLSQLSASCERLSELMEPGGDATNRDVLALLRDSQLTRLDPRMLTYLEEGMPAPSDQDDGEDERESEQEGAAIEAFLSCPASQFWGYRDYIEEKSPYSTHQGIKGAEFERVLVVLDDEEGKHGQFSYEKLFGVKSLSRNDEANVREGRETTIDRTRRLFYVCCTRALTDLAVVLFSADPSEAERLVRASGIFPDNAVHTLADLAS